MSNDKHLEAVDHSYIRYANVWEDADILIESLDIQEHHKVLSIASAGDNAFAMLSQNPSQVIAIDLNRVQLYLTELKKVAMQHLGRDEFLCFVGFMKDSNRWNTFQRLSKDLSQQAELFWDAKRELIESGIIYSGKFETYLKTFAKRLLPLIHKKDTISELFRKKTAAEQKEFYQNKWDNWSWRATFRLFLASKLWDYFGRDKAFEAS